MNHIYRSIWSEALRTWIAVAENTNSKCKRSNTRNKLLATGLLCCSFASWALPTGDQLVAGQATVSTPTANQMQIQQNSQQAIIDWQGFSIAPNEAVTIQQPNAQAALLNRVVGQDASQLQGQLNANGQVYLVNPNGVVFGKTAQVDVGGLVASTHNLSNADFLNGKNHLTQDGAIGSVDNQGTINTPDLGVVALIADRVSNSGIINTPKGTTVLAVGKTVDLDFQGNGLVEVKITEAALNAQITNKGAIQADAGRVVLTSKAAGQLIDTVINQQGIIRAQSMVERNGEIILDGGDSGTVQVSGTLNADAGASNVTGGKISVTGEQLTIQNGALLSASGEAGGGAIVVGDKQNTRQTMIQQGAELNVQTQDHGTAGTIAVFANMNSGTVNVAGKLNASAPKNGDGGFIETSAAQVKIADTAKVSTKANNGKTGHWLLDPVDFTIAASGGDITGATVSAALAGGNFTIQSASGANGVNGDVNVNDVVSWSANTLTLNAQRNININANMDGGIAGSLSLQYGQASANGGATDNYFIGKNISVNLPAGLNFSTQKGLAGLVIPYTVITDLGAELSTTTTDLQGMNNNLTGNYALGANIDASITSTWRVGFTPVGNSQTGDFSGNFDGLGHTITGLTINLPNTDAVGLFGQLNSTDTVGLSTISNIGLLSDNISGLTNVGGLVGINYGTVRNSYATGLVTGVAIPNPNFTGTGVGGLVGLNAGTVTDSYATGLVTGSGGNGTSFGGLVGFGQDSSSQVLNSYATTAVTGTGDGINVGGLIGGLVRNTTVSNSYASGSVTASGGTAINSNWVGGLIGGVDQGGTIINNSYATGAVTSINGNNNAVGGLIGHSDATITNTYASGAVTSTGTGNNVGGLLGELTSTVTNVTGSVSQSFWDTQNSGQSIGVGNISTGFTASVTGETTSQMTQLATFSNAAWDITNNVSSSIWRIYEGNTAPLLRLFLTPLTINSTISEAYTGLVHNSIANVSYSIAGAASSGHLFTTANPYGSAINVGSYALTGVYSDAQGYDITILGALSITPVSLTIAANADSKVYNGLAYTGGNGVSFTGLVNNETSSVLPGSLSYGGNSQGASNAGTYDITPSGLSASNYSISYVNGNLSINPAALTITANADSKVYDGLAYTGGNGVSFTGLVNNETSSVLAGSLSYGGNSQGASNAGTYDITPSGLTSSNYSISYINGNLSINPAALTITANADSKVYDGLAYTGGNGVSFTGLVNNETSSVLSGSLSYGGSSQGASNVGTYNISPSGLSSANYTISYASGTLSISPANLTLVSSTISKFFDGNTSANGTVLIANGTLFSSDTLSGGSFSFNNPNVGINKTVTLSNVQISDGNNGNNYQLSYIDNTNSRIESSSGVSDNIASLVKTTIGIDRIIALLPPAETVGVDVDASGGDISSEVSMSDSSSSFAGNARGNPLFSFFSIPEDNQKPIFPVLKIKNTAGQVKLLRMSADRQFLSLLLEDGSVRIWDFQSGIQRQIDLLSKKQIIADISAVNDTGETLSIASNTGIGVYDAFSAASDDQFTVHQPDIGHFAASSDNHLVFINAGADKLSLWDNKLNQERWQTHYERGVVKNLALNNDKHYGAVLSTQAGVYELTADKKVRPLTDAVEIINLDTGKIFKSLPNLGEQVVYMRFKDNDTLQLGLANGKLIDWSVATGKQKTVINFSENIIAADNDKDTYAYVSKNGMVRVANSQARIHLSIQNKENPFKHVQLLDNGKKILTVLATGDLALWDVASGKKMLRLFSTKQGWTVMDAFGRFDGSEEAMENFSWLANEEDIPLDSFSENYYEPGLLTSLLQNQDYLNNNPNMVTEGISLPPKVDLQLAEQQANDDKVALQLDVYDRGGGVDNIHLYHNGKLINNDNQQNKADEHHSALLNITPNAGKNTLKAVASNDMGIENSSTEISFDGKTKAYTSAVHLLTVGINQYSDPLLNLSYSVADAKSIGQALKSQSNISSSQILTDEKATKPKILAELRKLSQGAQQDSLIIYFAGHGIAVDKEWYFLPYETKLQPTPEKIAASGITATELGEIFKDSKIQHILLVVDSCYSGAGVDAFKFKKLQNNQRYFARKMSRTMGITVIAATAKDQEASELEKLGHGLFTYALTQEMEKKDNTTPLTAHRISESIVKILPAFSKKMLGFTQDPVVYTKGSDFTLIDSSNDKK